MDARRRPARVGLPNGSPAFHPILALAGVGLAIVLAACSARGGTSSNGVVTLGSTAPGSSMAPSPSADPQEAMLNFAQCMRDHGVDMPDPVFSTDGKGGGTVTQAGPASGANPKDDPGFMAAQEACKHFLDDVRREGTAKQLTAAEQKAFLDFAACMRDHGIDMPDPDFSGGGVSIQIGSPDGNGSDSGPKIGPGSATFEAAQTACQHFLDAVGMGKFGKGPSTSGGNGERSGPQVSVSPAPTGSEPIR
jgi:hypothetical protein